MRVAKYWVKWRGDREVQKWTANDNSVRLVTEVDDFLTKKLYLLWYHYNVSCRWETDLLSVSVKLYNIYG